MYKEKSFKLLLIGLFISLIFNFSLIDKYKRQTEMLYDRVDWQQEQISSLYENNTQLAQLNSSLNTNLTSIQTQLDTSNAQLKSLTATGNWCVQSGIATAYSPNDNQNGIEAEANGEYTSIGLHPGNGIIAVDPKRIPYNSQMIVIYSDGTTYKGIAGDTGGALRADQKLHVDIYKDTFVEAEQHGVQNVTIIWKSK